MIQQKNINIYGWHIKCLMKCLMCSPFPCTVNIAQFTGFTSMYCKPAYEINKDAYVILRLHRYVIHLCNIEGRQSSTSGHNWRAKFRHDNVIKWKNFPRYWPFVRGIHRSAVNSPHKGQWRGALIFSLICVWINGWVNKREARDLRRYRGHYDVIVMELSNFDK